MDLSKKEYLDLFKKEYGVLAARLDCLLILLEQGAFNGSTHLIPSIRSQMSEMVEVLANVEIEEDEEIPTKVMMDVTPESEVDFEEEEEDEDEVEDEDEEEEDEEEEDEEEEDEEEEDEEGEEDGESNNNS
jgi:hypothetical protein